MKLQDIMIRDVVQAGPDENVVRQRSECAKGESVAWW